MIGYFFRAVTGGSLLQKTLRKHFGGVPLSEIVTAAREFPITSRIDVQAALDQLFAIRADKKLLAVHSQMNQETPTLAHLFATGPFPIHLGPLQHDEVDIGDSIPIRCLKNGLWLSRQNDLPFAVLLAPAMHYGQAGGVHVEIGVPAGERGAQFSQELFRDLELRIGAGRTYRGRVISLESYYDYSGRGGSVKVHRLHKVNREDVILPQRTLSLLDRNVGGFIAMRGQIKALQFSGQKGLLFYGPPGTGKTHTIHYLASQLPEHTTLLITAEQIGLLGEYFRLARFLQPAMMIIEDVDLIAREREHMHNPGQESLLNKLLNEMDGLREDADVLVILTTNRPDQLEPALASRPGRIDQAIEFPLPDEEGRTKLVHLYSRRLEVSEALMDLIVRRTKGASPAFIKELMRRSAQFQIELRAEGLLQKAAVDAAIEEMVFTGGALNLKLLGGSATELGIAVDTQ
jgi:ATPase family associated with various cellular activities (AAA)